MRRPFLRARRQNGQALIFVVLAMFVLLGFAGLVVDIGRVYVAQRQLQQAVDAAALVAGQDLPDSAKAYCDAIKLSATPFSTQCPADGAQGVSNQTGVNRHTGMAPGAPKVTFKCVQFLVTNNVPCATDTGKNAQGQSYSCKPPGAQSPLPAGSTTCNAVSVSETASVDSTLLAHFLPGGFTTVAATSTAAMRGGVPHPLDIEVILDTTGSMASVKCGDPVLDENLDSPAAIASNNSLDIDCAKDGVRRLLKGLLPCSPSVVGNCGAASPEDEVGLMVFPGLANGNSTAHDSTGVRTNVALDAGTDSCPGKYDTSNGPQPPAWYLPAGQNEVEQITLTGATGGYFTLSFTSGGHNTQTTGHINYPATSTSVQTALEALSNINTGDVAVTGTPTPNGTAPPFTVTFQNGLGDQPINQLTVSDHLTGRNENVQVSTIQNGQASPVQFPTSWLEQDQTTNDFTYDGSPTYQLAPLSNDYRLSDSSGLNPNSSIVDAVSWDACGSSGNSGYPGNQYYGASAQYYTYYAGAIAAAQAALAADSARHAQPVIILLSDGDANITPQGSNADPCAAAVVNATNAANAGTWVYAIAYNSPTAWDSQFGKCNTVVGGQHIYTPFYTMQQIARTSAGVDDATKLFCVSTTQGSGTCQQNATSLAQAFQSIGTSLTDSRLLPDNTN